MSFFAKDLHYFFNIFLIKNFWFSADLSVSLTGTSARTVSLLLGESILRNFTFGFGEISIRPSASPWHKIIYLEIGLDSDSIFFLSLVLHICIFTFYPSSNSWEGQIIISFCKLWLDRGEWENEHEENKVMMHLVFQELNY